MCGYADETAAQFETLLQVAPDRVHLKALRGGVAIEAVQTTGLGAGDVVQFQPESLWVEKTTGPVINPYVVTTAASPYAQIAIAGTTFVNVQGSANVGDPLVAAAGGVAKVDLDVVDERRILGYAQEHVVQSDTQVKSISVRIR